MTVSNTILQGGDNLHDAFLIASLPFYDTGTTAGYANDFEPMCDTADGGTDIVYSYSPSRDLTISISSCGTSFHDIIYVFENDTANVVACSDFDESCPLNAAIDSLRITGGNTYYIVIDGYFSVEGEYILAVEEGPVIGYPEIRVTPTEIAEQVNIGNSINEIVTISNNGDADLNFRVTAIQEPLAKQGKARGGRSTDNINTESRRFTEKREVIELVNQIRRRGPDKRLILQGGEDINTAMPINTLPYHDIGNTDSASNDYEGTCGDTGGRDVVYSFIPARDMAIDISLCGSAFDTKLYVMENAPENVIICNDDFCDWQSRLLDVILMTGNIYYIVVDGFADGRSGDYILDVTENIHCVVQFPPDAAHENEICGEDDNGGCNSDPQMFEPIDANTILWGTAWSDPYRRDTDWYELIVAYPTRLEFAGEAEFPAQMALFNGADGCPPTSAIAAWAVDPCSTVVFETALDPGRYWIFISPDNCYDQPCDGSGEFGNDYVISVDCSPAWLRVDTDSGTVPIDGEPAMINVAFDASQLGIGNYRGIIRIDSDDPIFQVVDIPVTMTVNQPGCNYASGDINGSGLFNGIDVGYGVSFFKGGDPPPYSCDCSGSDWFVAGDVNANCVFNGIDISYMVGYFKGGPAPRPCPDCPPTGAKFNAGRVIGVAGSDSNVGGRRGMAEK